ncbi:uncharacterized protein LOC143921348 [Arctopsyche grandis]|uniref:uncharacterized protein LOC143921348 n=1 Tax=Arctopsyche grandis TaxID=121162 RepID=UPI00406D990D
MLKKHDIVLVQIFIVLWMTFGAMAADDNLGPADITIERIEECENSEQYPEKLPFKMNKINRTHAGFTGCMIPPGDLDENSAINLTLSKWGDGGWKPNALNFFQADICKVLKENTESPWDSFMRACGREDGSCPTPQGSYCIEKMAFALDGLFPSMLYGKFRIDAIFIYNSEPFMCIRAFFNSDPSKGGGPPSGRK